MAPLVDPGALVRNRYRDAYRVGAAATGIGDFIKVAGIVIAILIALGALVAGSQQNSGLEQFVMVAGLVVAATVGAVIYVLGVLVSALGQVLRASLDSAVNSSPFLTDEHKLDAMSLL